MLARACVIVWILCLFSFAYSDISLNQMNRLSTVTLERGKAEFMFTIRLSPNRGINEAKVWTVNGNSIVLVKLPKTYVDPQVKDFGLANDWIESVRAHQFDSETVNLRIALKEGFYVDKNLLKSEVLGDNVILYMPLPTRANSAPKPPSEAILVNSSNSIRAEEASEKIESTTEAIPEIKISETVSSDLKDEQSDENRKPVEDVEQMPDSSIEAETEPKSTLGSTANEDLSNVSLTAQNSELLKQNEYKSFSIAKFVAVSLGLCGLLLVAFGAFKKLKKSAFGSIQPRVTNRCSLGFKKYLAVVEFEGARFLIAVGPHDTTLLARLDEKGEPQKFETVLVNQTCSSSELSVLEQIKSKVAMLSPLDRQ